MNPGESGEPVYLECLLFFVFGLWSLLLYLDLRLEMKRFYCSHWSRNNLSADQLSCNGDNRSLTGELVTEEVFISEYKGESVF
jgi:hypothetical protein